MIETKNRKQKMENKLIGKGKIIKVYKFNSYVRLDFLEKEVADTIHSHVESFMP